MTNQDNTDGIAALLQAAGEVHDQMNAPGGRATVEAPTVPSTSDITEQLRRMSETFSAHLTVITGKVDSLAERVDHVERERSPPTATPPPQTPAPGGSENQTPMTSTTPWWQRDPNERLVVDPNEDPDDTEPEEQGCPLHTVSSTTEALLKDACSKTVSNDTRRRWRKQFGMPANDRTKCPKLDTTLKARLPKQCKENDRSLARLQTMVLDAMGPLTHLLELQQRGQLTPEAVTDSASQAIKFVGNASTAISQERRRRAGTFFNEDLKAFIEEQEQAAPLLFGKEFLGIAKTHAESVKALDRMAQKANQRQSRQQSQQFFRTGRPYQAARRGRKPLRRQPRLQRKRPIQAVLNSEQGKPRKRKKELPAALVRDSVVDQFTTEFVYVYPQLPLLMSVLEKEKFFLTTQLLTVHALQSKGVQHIATEMARLQLPLAGRISNFISNWEAITQDKWMLDSVLGYRIEFLRKPNQNHRPPLIAFTEKEEECMQEEIQNMLDKQAISETGDSPQGFYSQMFLVPKKDGRQRPVINLKRLNQSVKTEHFKMEGTHMLKDLLKAGDWMAKIDLKDAYFMIPMAQEDRAFLCFQWRDKAYQFNCLPFGLSSARGSLPRLRDR